MANEKLSELASITSAQSDDADLILVTDTDAATSKSMTLAEADTRFSLKGTNISGATAATVATGDLVAIADIDDSNGLKKVTTQSIADLGAASLSTWSITIGGGGTLTTTITNAFYWVDGDFLYCHADILQTAAGSGTDDITLSVPTGTVADNNCVGAVSGFDIGNDNVNSVHTVAAVNSSNVFKINRTGTATYFRGGTMIGNNSSANFSVNIRARLA